MLMEIKYTTKFRKQYRKADKKIKSAFAQTLELLLTDTHNPFLRNHTLKDKYAGYRNIDVTDDWRAVFKETKLGEKTLYLFHMLGTHKELYG